LGIGIGEMIKFVGIKNIYVLKKDLHWIIVEIIYS
jgi:hypothetical protein